MGGAALVGGSRGGLLALLIMLGLSARGPSGRERAGRLALAIVLIVLAGVWIGSDIFYSTIERLAEEIGQPEESWCLRIWADALRLLGQFPALGTGLGTFGVVHALVRPVMSSFVYLALAVALGLRAGGRAGVADRSEATLQTWPSRKPGGEMMPGESPRPSPQGDYANDGAVFTPAKSSMATAGRRTWRRCR